MTPIKLSNTLYRLVLCLYEREGFCTNVEILRAAWGDENYTDDTVRQAVARLKKGLKDAGVDPDLYIVNVPGRGYKLQNKA
jgi:DNA-binding winged helix-turn-helix (wHTH) protein